MGSLMVQMCWQLYYGLTEEMRCVTEGGEHVRKDVWRYSGWGGRGGVTSKETTALHCRLARHDMGCVGIECLRADDIELREMRHRRQRSKQAGAMMRSSIKADQPLVLC